MATAQSTKPLTARTVEVMKPGDKDKSDTGENMGLRVTCGATGVKTFFYRYTSPITKKLVQMKIGSLSDTSPVEARFKLQELKQIRRQGHCPPAEAKERQKEEVIIQEQERVEAAKKLFTVTDLIELYLTQYIGDRKSSNGRIIPGARKPKGQSETRRTLYGDAIPKWDDVSWIHRDWGK